MYHNNAHWVFRNVVFIRNIASIGGAFHTLSTTYDFQMYNCSFISNFASGHGGALFFVQYVSDFLFNKCVFHNNTAMTGSGGVIYAVQEINGFTYENCSFSENWASDSGGVLVAVGNNEMHFNNCMFYENTARNGGAIALLVLNEMRVSASVFTRNSATGVGGGGIYALSDNHITVSSSIFSENKGFLGAGIALLSNNIKFLVFSTLFNLNTGNYGVSYATGNISYHIISLLCS